MRRATEGGLQGRKTTITDKECQAQKTGMLQLYVSHLATSLPPPSSLHQITYPLLSPSPAELSNSTNLLQMYGCASNKTHSAPGAEDVGLR